MFTRTNALLFALLLCLPVWAEDIYVSQNGSGDQTGSSAGNAHSMAWLTTSGNWGAGAGQVGPGDKVRFVGIITDTLVVYASGTAGSPITLYFEPNAKFSRSFWPTDAILINITGREWIVIDGGTNGRLEATDNGTGAEYGGNHTYQTFQLNGIYGSPKEETRSDHITIQNLTITNLFDRLPNSDDPPHGSGNDQAINLKGSWLVVSNCNLSAQDCIGYLFGPEPYTVQDVLMISNKIWNFNHGLNITAGRPVNPECVNVRLIGNIINGRDAYAYQHDQPSDIPFHRNPVFYFNEAGDYSGFLSGFTVYGNWINMGESPSLELSQRTGGTAAIFIAQYYARQVHGVKIYNNVFTLHGDLPGYANGFISNAGQDGLVANNLFLGKGAPLGTGSNCLVVNNLCISNTIAVLESIGSGDLGLEYLYCSLDYNLRYHCGTDASSWVSFRYLVSATPAFAVNEVLTGQSSGVTARFGRYYNNYDGTWYLDVRWTQNAFTPGETVTGNTLNLTIGSFINAAVRSSPYDDWKAFTGNDAHTLYIDPLLNPVTFIPAENSPAIAAGTNLYSAGITNDILGNARPTNGLWTIGPWEGGTNTPTPDVMANFSAIPTLGLAPLTVSFTDSSTGSPIQWEWDFANNGLWTSDVQNPSFTYSNAGIYSVKLTVNGTNSLIRAGHITVTNAPSAPETNGFYIKDAHINQIIFR